MNMQLNRLAVVICFAISGCAAFPARADWPAFRGPNRDGIVRNRDLPTAWSPSTNIGWRTELPGQGWSSPVVVGDRIYLTAAIAEQTADNEQATQNQPAYRLVLFCVAAESGELLQEVELFRQAADAPRIHQKNSHASPTAVYDGENLFVHFGHQGTACVSLQGDVLWKNDSLGYQPVHGGGGSPSVVGELLIFSRDGAETAEITALDKRSGQVVWKSQRGVEAQKKFSFCTPLVASLAGQQQLILPGSNVVQSLDPTNGQEIWRVRYDGYSVIPRPIVEAGMVFVCTGYNRPSLLAIDPSGRGDVTDTHVKWSTNSNVPHTPSLIGFDSKLLMVNDTGGIVSCLDALSGRELWKERVGGNFSASPLLVDSKLYLLDEEGTCSVLDVSGEPQELAKNRIGERCLSSFAVIDNDLLLRSENALYRISNQSQGSSRPFVR